MVPALVNDPKENAVSGESATIEKPITTTSILHRTPWRPPTAVSAQGIYVTLANGQRIIDGVGGAAVACIGNGHPVVIKAIKDQVDKVACKMISSAGDFKIRHKNETLSRCL